MSAKKGKSPKTKYQIRKMRVFSEAFKKKRVEEILNKVMTVQQISELYEVSRPSVYRWLYTYSPDHKRGTKTVIEMESEAEKTKRLMQELKEMQAALGRKQLELEYLNKILDIAKVDLGYDLKKNIEQKLSNGLD
jgi:transposase